MRPPPLVAVLPDPLGLRARAARIGRRAAAEAVDTAGRGGVALVDRVLAWQRTQEALDLALQSSAAERAVRTLAEGRLPDLAIRTLIREGIASRVAEELIAGGVARQVTDRLLTGPELDEIVCAVVDDPRTGALVAHVLETDGTERIVAQLLESRVVDAAVTRALAGEELWRVVEAVAGSEAVTEAITRQGVGFADQVADDIGERSRRADARLERAANRLLRRRERPGGGPPPLAQPKPR
jgi:hypothetical protein